MRRVSLSLCLSVPLSLTQTHIIAQRNAIVDDDVAWHEWVNTIATLSRCTFQLALGYHREILSSENTEIDLPILASLFFLFLPFSLALSL